MENRLHRKYDFQIYHEFNFAFIRVRGTLNSMLILACNFGVLIGFIFAEFLDYAEQLKINIMLPVLFLVAFHFCIRETPEYLLKRNQTVVSEAEYENEFTNEHFSIRMFNSTIVGFFHCTYGAFSFMLPICRLPKNPKTFSEE